MIRLSAIYVYCLIVLGLVCVSCAVSTPMSVPTQPSPANDFPLKPGNSWTYLVGRYLGRNPSEILTSMRTVTETVAEVKTVSSYFVATIRRETSTEFPIYVPPSMQGMSAADETPSEYWLIVDGNRIYRQLQKLDTSNLPNRAALIFEFPLSVGAKWFETNETAQLNPNVSLIQATKLGSVVVPAGRFENCYFLTEIVGATGLEDWFCPGIGYVDRKDFHSGTPMGGREVLVRYHLEK